MENTKEICGHCSFYDLWYGICLNEKSDRFKRDEDRIFDLPCCDKFKKGKSIR